MKTPRGWRLRQARCSEASTSARRAGSSAAALCTTRSRKRLSSSAKKMPRNVSSMKRAPPGAGSRTAARSSSLSVACEFGDGRAGEVARELQEVVRAHLLAHRLEQVGDAARAREGVQRGVELELVEHALEPRQQPVLRAHEAQLRVGARLRPGRVAARGDGAHGPDDSRRCGAPYGRRRSPLAAQARRRGQHRRALAVQREVERGRTASRPAPGSRARRRRARRGGPGCAGCRAPGRSRSGPRSSPATGTCAAACRGRRRPPARARARRRCPG